MIDYKFSILQSHKYIAYSWEEISLIIYKHIDF